MPLTGLSNQWKSYDGLVDGFASGFRNSPDEDEKYRLITQLFENLNIAAESLIYVGTAHSLMNFSTRDAVSIKDRTQPFAYVSVMRNQRTKDEFHYFVKTPVMLALRPTPQWETVIKSDVNEVVGILLDAFSNAETPIRRNNG